MNGLSQDQIERSRFDCCAGTAETGKSAARHNSTQPAMAKQRHAEPLAAETVLDVEFRFVMAGLPDSTFPG
jgi:hypothetical protein